MTKQDSTKSHTDVEEDWSDDESHPVSRKSNTPRVSFKADNEISETIEIVSHYGNSIYSTQILK